MTSLQLPSKRKRIIDIHQKSADLVRSASEPVNEVGKLPKEKIVQAKRVILHLNSFKKTTSVLSQISD